MDTTDTTTPRALEVALASLEKEFGAGCIPDGARVAISRSVGYFKPHPPLKSHPPRYAAVIKLAGGSYIPGHEALDITEAEHAEWLYWRYFKEYDAHQLQRAKLKKILTDAGHYSFRQDGPGINTAIHLYELALMAKPKSTAVELLRIDQRLERIVDRAFPMTHPSWQMTVELPGLADGRGWLTITARRALVALRDVGLLEATGTGRGMRYTAVVPKELALN